MAGLTASRSRSRLGSLSNSGEDIFTMASETDVTWLKSLIDGRIQEAKHKINEVRENGVGPTFGIPDVEVSPSERDVVTPENIPTVAEEEEEVHWLRTHWLTKELQGDRTFESMVQQSEIGAFFGACSALSEDFSLIIPYFLLLFQICEYMNWTDLKITTIHRNMTEEMIEEENKWYQEQGPILSHLYRFSYGSWFLFLGFCVAFTILSVIFAVLGMVF